MIHRDKLISYIKSVRGLSFEWGVMDCTLFPVYCAQALMQDKVGDEHTGRWSNLKEACRYGKEHGLTLESWLLEIGGECIPDNYQQVGDFLLANAARSNGKPWLTSAICIGRDAAICNENGVNIYPMSVINHKKIIGFR